MKARKQAEEIAFDAFGRLVIPVVSVALCGPLSDHFPSFVHSTFSNVSTNPSDNRRLCMCSTIDM